MWLLALACACSCAGSPDPEALLRARDLAGASAAWERLHGAPLDIAHPVAEILADRAVRDPAITVAALVETMAAVRLLEGGRRVHTQSVDRPFDRAADLLTAASALAEGPALVAVGRSAGPGDPDPAYASAPLPYDGGRVVGAARTDPGGPGGDLAELGGRLDANPPARLVTLALRDATGSVWLYTERKDGAWWVLSASDARGAARILVAAELFHDQGAEAMIARVGRGFLR